MEHCLWRIKGELNETTKEELLSDKGLIESDGATELEH